jgi:hypothetical protein
MPYVREDVLVKDSILLVRIWRCVCESFHFIGENSYALLVAPNYVEHEDVFVVAASRRFEEASLSGNVVFVLERRVVCWR